MEGTLQTIEGRSFLRFERRLDHRPEKVWRAITELDHLAHWFPAEIRMDFVVGGKIQFDYNSEGETLDGEILELDPPRVFSFTWGGPALRWELVPDGDGTLLVFTQAVEPHQLPSAASYAAGWQMCIDAMEALLDGVPGERAGAQWMPLHEGYLETFRLGQGKAETTDNGWTLRFDRQLSQPVDTIWDMLVADSSTSDGLTVGARPPWGFTTAVVPAETVTAVEAPKLLEYEWMPGGRLRFELADGAGGAVITLIQTGPAEAADRRADFLAGWQVYLERLAIRVNARHADGPSSGRIADLRKHYARLLSE